MGEQLLIDIESTLPAGRKDHNMADMMQWCDWYTGWGLQIINKVGIGELVSVNTWSKIYFQHSKYWDISALIFNDIAYYVIKNIQRNFKINSALML